MKPNFEWLNFKIQNYILFTITPLYPSVRLPVVIEIFSLSSQRFPINTLPSLSVTFLHCVDVKIYDNLIGEYKDYPLRPQDFREFSRDCLLILRLSA